MLYSRTMATVGVEGSEPATSASAPIATGVLVSGRNGQGTKPSYAEIKSRHHHVYPCDNARSRRPDDRLFVCFAGFWRSTVTLRYAALTTPIALSTAII